MPSDEDSANEELQRLRKRVNELNYTLRKIKDELENSRLRETERIRRAREIVMDAILSPES